MAKNGEPIIQERKLQKVPAGGVQIGLASEFFQTGLGYKPLPWSPQDILEQELFPEANNGDGEIRIRRRRAAQEEN